jgi:hypothetical protein
MKDGLRAVINKLLVNLKRYPQDRRSILLTFKAGDRELFLRDSDPELVGLVGSGITF